MATKSLATKCHSQETGPEEGQAKALPNTSAGRSVPYIHFVSASVAARITSEGCVINKLGRSAISEQQISPKYLKWTLAPHSVSFCSVHRVPHVARRQSCSARGLATNCHCALSPCPPPPLSCSCFPQWQEPGKAAFLSSETITSFNLEVFNSFLLFLRWSTEQNPQPAQLQTCNTQAGKGMQVP